MLACCLDYKCSAGVGSVRCVDSLGLHKQVAGLQGLADSLDIQRVVGIHDEVAGQMDKMVVLADNSVYGGRT